MKGRDIVLRVERRNAHKISVRKHIANIPLGTSTNGYKNYIKITEK
jgi:hypothetical protein